MNQVLQDNLINFDELR